MGAHTLFPSTQTLLPSFVTSFDDICHIIAIIKPLNMTLLPVNII